MSAPRRTPEVPERGGIGILGGSFNPVHVGHLALAEAAREALGLEKVLFVPAGHPPHKPPSALAAAEHRLAMLRLALADHPGFEVCDIEVRRGGVSYTICTVRALREAHPGRRLVFLIGADTLGELPSWREAARLVELCEIVPFTRPGCDLSAGRARLAQGLGEATAEAIFRRLTAMPPQAVSASEVRARVAEGRPIEGLVSEPVRRYIEAHGLYRRASLA